MRFHHLKNWIVRQLASHKSLRNLVVTWYIVALMVETRKHSINYAAALSGLNKSQFSKYLANNKNVAAITLDSLSKKQGKKLGKIKQKVEGLPWSIFLIIDATIQNRSSERSDNVQKFNHGKGYVIGHQWTK